MDQQNTREIERIVRDGLQKPITLPDGSTVLVMPAGYNPHRLDPTEATLFRIHARPALYDLPSFVAYVNRYKTATTRIFAKTAPAAFTAVFDYHHAATDESKAGAPNHAAHVATYAPKYSEEWKAWMAAAREPMGQIEFAEFIEENRRDVRDPAAAVLLDMITNFKAKRAGDFSSVVHLANGNVRLGHTDETTANAGKDGMQVPELLTIGIPVFFKGPPFEIGVFLRYRVDKGVVRFGLKIDRPDYVETSAFDDIVAQAHEATQIEVYQGATS